MADPAAADSTLNPSYVGLRTEIADRVPESAVRILDLGAADGALGAFLLDGRPGRTVVGVELDESMATIARERLSEVHGADLETLDWGLIAADGGFDCVVAADVLEHLREPDAVVGRVVDLLSPSGTVVLSVPNIRHVSAFWSIYVRGTFPRRGRGLFDVTHLRWFTVDDCFALCQRVGLEVVDVGFNFRVFDAPGGRVNNVVSRARWLDRIPGLRQLLGYQVVITAERSPSHSGSQG